MPLANHTATSDKDTNNRPFSFVVITHPETGRDSNVKSQVRRHVAYRWHEDLRRRAARLPSRQQRILAPKQQIKEAEVQVAAPEDTEEINKAESIQEEQALVTRSSTSSPITYLGGGRADPFNSCAVRCNTMEDFLLDHYFQTFAAKVSAIYKPTELTSIQPHLVVSEWVSLLITDAGILAGVFLRACRTLSVVTSKQYLDKLALTYRARCIQALSAKITSMSTALSVEAIAMMLMLTTDEFYMGSAKTMRYHVDAMQRIIKLKGGLQDTALEGTILRLVEWNDLQCTLLMQNAGQPRKYPVVDLLTSGFPVFS